MKWNTLPRPGVLSAAEFSTHHLRKFGGDGKPQTRAAETPRGRSIRLHEWLENKRQLLGGNADAGIAHADMQIQGVVVEFVAVGLVPGVHPQIDFAALGKLDGVAHQIDDDLPEAIHIAVKSIGQIDRHGRGQFQLFLMCPYRQRAKHVADAVAQD